MKTGKVDVRKLAEGIVKSNEDVSPSTLLYNITSHIIVLNE